MVAEDVWVLEWVEVRAWRIMGRRWDRHLCEIDCLESELSQTFSSVYIRLGRASDTSSTKL
jgi:Holliday junction resolvase-like predicted endonuclease